MCGIAGGFNVSKNTVELMAYSMRLRGADGFGVYSAGSFCMAMTRLAIVDPKMGEQPFSSADGLIQVIFNGEIYNWKLLRSELEELGYCFQTNCDGEVLPMAWQEWGEGMFLKLNGMFSIALFDVLKGELILARDQCGQKPLYYSEENGAFLFASEIKALQKGGVSLSPNRAKLAQYLVNRYVSEPDTLFQGIKVLPAGHWVRITSNGESHFKKYWEPNEVTSTISPQSLSDAITQLDELTNKAISQTTQSDWKSVVYLSSGVDSSLLTYYMKNLGADFTSLAIGFQSSQDETYLAESFAKSLGVEHHNIYLNEDSLEELPRVVAQMERPVGDALIIAFDALSKGAVEMGAKVAYGAEGIDEHFGGYSFHQAYLKAQALGSVGRFGASSFLELAPDKLLDRFSNFPASLGQEGKKRVVHYLKKFTAFSQDWQADYLRYLYTPEELQNVMHPSLAPSVSGQKGRGGTLSVDQLLLRQYQSWLQDWSLIRQDKNSMAHTLEYRCPFLDPRLISFAFSLPEKWKIQTNRNKWIWRKLAERKLPKANARRPKVPFYLPLEQKAWRGKLIEMSNDLLTPQALSQHGFFSINEVNKLKKAEDFLSLKKLASLLIFQIWFNTYF